MRLRSAIALAAIALAAVTSAAREARAADPVVARDTDVYKLYALDGDLVYLRAQPERACMALAHGRLHRAREIGGDGIVPHGGLHGVAAQCHDEQTGLLGRTFHLHDARWNVLHLLGFK